MNDVMNPITPSLNLLLEITNGAWSIISVSMLIFLTFYLRESAILRRVSPRQWFGSLPVSMQLAVGLYVLCAGILLRSIFVWLWRIAGGGEFGTLQLTTVMTGTAIGCIGLLCMLRVVSRARYGHWPWAMTGAVVVLYIASVFLFRSGA